MTTLKITLDITDENPEDAYNGAGITWGRFLELLGYHTPANKDLSIRDGLGEPIYGGLQVGNLTINVEDPYVAPPKPRDFAKGTIVVEGTAPNVTTYVKLDGTAWFATYSHGQTSYLENFDHVIETDLQYRIGGAKIVFDPSKN